MDAQCGSKFLRNTEAVRAALSLPFRTRWGFDVELIARLLIGARGVAALSPNDFLEAPLEVWTDVEESKVRPAAALHAFAERVRVARDVHRAKSCGPRP